MVTLDTITSPHSRAWLSVCKQLDCLRELGVFTLPELAAWALTRQQAWSAARNARNATGR